MFPGDEDEGGRPRAALLLSPVTFFWLVGSLALSLQYFPQVLLGGLEGLVELLGELAAGLGDVGLPAAPAADDLAQGPGQIHGLHPVEHVLRGGHREAGLVLQPVADDHDPRFDAVPRVSARFLISEGERPSTLRTRSLKPSTSWISSSGADPEASCSRSLESSFSSFLLSARSCSSWPGTRS